LSYLSKAWKDHLNSITRS